MIRFKRATLSYLNYFNNGSFRKFYQVKVYSSVLFCFLNELASLPLNCGQNSLRCVVCLEMEPINSFVIAFTLIMLDTFIYYTPPQIFAHLTNRIPVV